jgi:hypothetical protein
MNCSVQCFKSLQGRLAPPIDFAAGLNPHKPQLARRLNQASKSIGWKGKYPFCYDANSVRLKRCGCLFEKKFTVILALI